MFPISKHHLTHLGINQYFCNINKIVYLSFAQYISRYCNLGHVVYLDLLICSVKVIILSRNINLKKAFLQIYIRRYQHLPLFQTNTDEKENKMTVFQYFFCIY